MQWLVVTGASQHNLKNVSCELPRNQLVVITGPSGSGKSSLAFDTIYAEGQRRYVESLSAYARQFLDQLPKPRVESIEGLSPAIAIEQRALGKSPRSTVGTVTEIADYLRLLYARAGTPHCPKSGKVLRAFTVQEIVDTILDRGPGARLSLLAPVTRGRKGELKSELKRLRREGFVRVGIDGRMVDLGLRSQRLRRHGHRGRPRGEEPRNRPGHRVPGHPRGGAIGSPLRRRYHRQEKEKGRLLRGDHPAARAHARDRRGGVVGR